MGKIYNLYCTGGTWGFHLDLLDYIKNYALKFA